MNEACELMMINQSHFRSINVPHLYRRVGRGRFRHSPMQSTAHIPYQMHFPVGQGSPIVPSLEFLYSNQSNSHMHEKLIKSSQFSLTLSSSLLLFPCDCGCISSGQVNPTCPLDRQPISPEGWCSLSLSLSLSVCVCVCSAF